jgi:uncharacterized protein involved in exopolysaccharide biosynthesis/Mrp family chromosome partitioning ATPase
MNAQHATHEIILPAAQDSYAVSAPVVAAPVSPLAEAARILRGRYAWACALSAVFAALGAFAGATLPKPVYVSHGVIEVAPKVPKVLYESEDKGMLPMFDSYIFSQVAQISGRRVTDMAMQSDAWKQLGKGTTDDDVAKFQGELGVGHGPRTQLIDITFTDEDPVVAVTAVNEVIRAYMKVVDQNEQESGLIRIHALERQRTIDNGRLAELRSEVLAATDGLGEEAIEANYANTIAKVTKLEADIKDLDVQVAALKAAKSVANVSPAEATDKELAAHDETLRGLLAKKESIEDRLLHMKEIDGFGPEHPLVKNDTAELRLLETKIAARSAEVRADLRELPDPRDLKLKELDVQRQQLVALKASVEEDMKALGKKRLALANLRQERDTVAGRLEDAKQNLETINVESSLKGRISVLAYGERPLGPDTDRRRPLAVLGAVGGVGLGFGLVLLWGLREAKVRHVVDVDGQASRGRFLGVVPEVQSPDAPVNPEDPAALGVTPEMGDYCVHHIRAMLQLRSVDRKCVVALTSPSPGAGKTTLGLALGMSFAATGTRTIVIDCDFVGHGMTSAMRSLVCDIVARTLAGDAPPQNGDGRQKTRRVLMATLLAARRKSYTDEGVAGLLAAARERAEAGEVEFQSAVRALEAVARRGASTGSRDGVRGILAAVAGYPLENCVVETDIPNLSLLPVGDAHEDDAKSLSHAGIERLIDVCRERYDAVIIDSGPIMGSIEAAFAVAAAKDVLLVVSRGERRPLVDEATARVEGIGARIAGVVFNRASTADVVRSSYASRPKSVAADFA